MWDKGNVTDVPKKMGHECKRDKNSLTVRFEPYMCT